jgi:hypothetical protein
MNGFPAPLPTLGAKESVAVVLRHEPVTES